MIFSLIIEFTNYELVICIIVTVILAGLVETCDYLAIWDILGCVK